MKTKEVVDDITMNRAITRITYEIIERNKDLNQVVLAGIKTRGVHLAHRIQKRLAQLENIDIPVAEVDTKPFRDDIKVEEDTTVIPVDDYRPSSNSDRRCPLHRTDHPSSYRQSGQSWTSVSGWLSCLGRPWSPRAADTGRLCRKEHSD